MKHLATIFSCILILLLLSGCQHTDGIAPPGTSPPGASPPDVSLRDASVRDDSVRHDSAPNASSSRSTTPERDNHSYIPPQEAPGTELFENDLAAIDSSHSSEGYFMALYKGSNPKVKLLVTSPDGTKCYYDLIGTEYVSFPLPEGDGTYSITVYEQISGSNYSTALSVDIQVSLKDELLPFLQPSQYVFYTMDSPAVQKARELAEGARLDMDVVTAVYKYVTENITYDHEKALSPPSGYVASVDDTFSSETGICLDYAALMTCMLRSQHIPTRLEVGYAGEVYHAWISVYLQEEGWVDHVIYFDGKHWSLMDPTFAANMNRKDLSTFIGDGNHYLVKHTY